MTEAAGSSSRVEVDIFGHRYPVRGDGDAERLHHLAELVDSKMKQVAARVATVDTAKIAILAALNIAEELVQSRTERDDGREYEASFVEKVAELSTELEGALEG